MMLKLVLLMNAKTVPFKKGRTDMIRLNKRQHDPTTSYKSINWNEVEDMVDKLTWEKLTSQFWLDTRMVPSNDLSDWSKLSEAEKTLFNKVFGGLTMLDTLQGEDGNAQILKDAKTQHEIAVLTNIQFMEQVHAKSYSTIFSTLCSPAEINEIFRWTEENKYLQYKANVIRDIYLNGTPLQKKATSVLLESFLFYSGFYAPLWYMGNGKMVNVAEIIRLILRDESVHGTYIGYKFRIGMDELSEEDRQVMTDWVYDLLLDLYQNESRYTEELYDEVGWSENVKVFLKYNANKALMNLGLDPFFSETVEDVDPIVMNGISTTTSNMDFFSSVGNGYLLSDVETMKDSDYDF